MSVSKPEFRAVRTSRERGVSEALLARRGWGSSHGLSSKWTYLCRTVPNISNLLKPLDDILQTKLMVDYAGGYAVL